MADKKPLPPPVDPTNIQPKKPPPPPVDEPDEPEFPKPPPEEKPDTPPPSQWRPPSSPDNPDSSGIDKEKLVGFLEDIIDTLTFKRIGLMALLVVIGLALFSFYENRVPIVERLIHLESPTGAPIPTVWTLSEKSKIALQDLAKSSSVTFISISDIDLKKNRRSIRYYYFDNNPPITISAEAQRAISLPQAVFDYDPKNTAQMVAVLSNEFRCDPYQDTINYRYAPELKDKIPLVCRIAIPPFVGQIVGILTVGISPGTGSMPGGKQELDSIRLELSRLAVDIYLNDVIKKETPSPGSPLPK